MVNSERIELRKKEFGVDSWQERVQSTKIEAYETNGMSVDGQYDALFSYNFKAY